MTSAGKPLSAEEAAALLALPTRTRAASGNTRQVGTSGRTVRIDTTDRSIVMWWKLPTTATDCTVSRHDEKESERNRMCAKIGDNMVCRYCYVTSRDLNVSSS